MKPEKFAQHWHTVKPFTIALVVLVLLFITQGIVNAQVNAQVNPQSYDDPTLTADFLVRDVLPESPVPVSEWDSKRGWGPVASTYPPVPVPPGRDPVLWKRARIIMVAKKYRGLPYRHHHIPGWDPSPESNPRSPGRGLDCSNFTSWVYNYGLGIKFASHILRQSSGPAAPGRLLDKDEAFEPGDLLFILKRNRSRVSHVVIYINEEHIIDSHNKCVDIRAFQGWYRTHFSHARRIME